MITIKEYATQSGKSVQAVYKQIKGKELSAALEGHLVKTKVNNKKVLCLDDEAVRILIDASKQSIQVMEQIDQSERIDQLTQERENLLIKVAELSAQVAALSSWQAEKAVEIAAAEQQKQLLTSVQGDLAQANVDLEGFRRQVAETNQIVLQREAEIDDLKIALQAEKERPLTWRERLLGRRNLA